MIDVLANSSHPGGMPSSFHGSLEFYKGDFTVENWADADILFGGLLPDDQLMKKLSDKFRLLKNGAKILMLKDINPDYLKDIGTIGASNHKLGWTSNHPIYSYERKDGQKTEKEIKEVAEKVKADKLAQDIKDAGATPSTPSTPSTSYSAPTSALLASLSSAPASTTTDYKAMLDGLIAKNTAASSSTSTWDQIMASAKASTPATPVAAPSADFDALVASFLKPAPPTASFKLPDLSLPTVIPSTPTSLGASYDSLLASLNKPSFAATPVAPVVAAPATDYKSILDGLTQKANAVPATQSFDDILASFQAKPAEAAKAAEPISAAWKDTFKAVLDKTLNAPSAAPKPPPSLSAFNGGSVLGDIGGFNKPKSILGISLPAEASLLQVEDVASTQGEIQAVFGEHKDETLRAEDPPDMAFRRQEIKLDNGKSVFVFEKIGEQDERAVAISRLASATTNLIAPMPGIDMKHGSQCTHSW